MKKYLLILILLILAFACRKKDPQPPDVQPPVAEPCSTSVLLSWNPNTESDLFGYRVYRDTLANVTKQSHSHWVGKATSVTIDSLHAPQTWYFAVSAWDYSGNQSGLSEIVSVDLTCDTTKVPPPDSCDGDIVAGINSVLDLQYDNFEREGNNLRLQPDKFRGTIRGVTCETGGFMLALETKNDVDQADEFKVFVKNKQVGSITTETSDNNWVTRNVAVVQLAAGDTITVDVFRGGHGSFGRIRKLILHR